MKISKKNRYDKLKALIMCYPVEYRPDEVQIDRTLMFRQYNNFINLLTKEGVSLYFLDPFYGKNQVYTRDVGFVIDDILFISKMTNKKRLEEYKALEKYAIEEKLHIHRMSTEIEGGDIILHKNLIFIGLSTRTRKEAIEELKMHLKRHKKNYEIIPIRFDADRMLHLDCVFNIVNEDSCIISQYVYDKKILESFFENYYYINERVSLELGTNFISLGDNKIISANKEVCKLLESKGVKVFFIDYSEFIKGGGAFTCTTLPIYVE